jgi:hypothetical protein
VIPDPQIEFIIETRDEKKRQRTMVRAVNVQFHDFIWVQNESVLRNVEVWRNGGSVDDFKQGGEVGRCVHDAINLPDLVNCIGFARVT